METEDVWGLPTIFLIRKFCGMNLWWYKHQPIELQSLNLCSSLQAEAYNHGMIAFKC